MKERSFGTRCRSAVYLGLLLAVFFTGSASADTPSNSTAHPNPHYFRVLNKGTELSFYGRIDPPVAHELEVLLTANPDATIIHLNSPGGSVKEARRMAALIANAHIAAIADTYCYSACALAFLGATERYITPDARIGFHHESNRDGSVADIAESEKIDQTFMASRGLPASFLKKAFSTPASDIWTPTTKELTDANVITGVRSDFTMAGYAGNSDEDKVDGLMKASILLAPLKTAADARFAAIKTVLLEAQHRGATYAAVSALYAQQLDGVINDYVVRSSDDLMIAYASTEAALIRRVLAQNPAACSLTRSSDGGVTLRMQPANDSDYDASDKARVKAVVEGAVHPVRLPTSLEVETARAALQLAFRAKHADEVDALNDLASPRLAPGKGCQILADYLEVAISLPKAEAATYLRYDYSGLPGEQQEAQKPAPASQGPKQRAASGATRSD